MLTILLKQQICISQMMGESMMYVLHNSWQLGWDLVVGLQGGTLGWDPEVGPWSENVRWDPGWETSVGPWSETLE